jgi:hypothetical protein
LQEAWQAPEAKEHGSQISTKQRALPATSSLNAGSMAPSRPSKSNGAQIAGAITCGAADESNACQLHTDIARNTEIAYTFLLC